MSQQRQRQRIMTSLFQAALRNMRISAGAFDRGDYQTGSMMAEKAAAIVLGLQGTLKTEVAPELCERLSELYLSLPVGWVWLVPSSRRNMC